MEAVTYSLQTENKDSEEYYGEIRKLTDEVLLYAEHTISPYVDEFISYIKEYKIEKVREKEEYILELLSFGILWRIYAPYALSVSFAPFVTLSKMGEWRKKHQNVKPLIDLTRGILTTAVLLPRNKKEEVSLPQLEMLDRVCLWFEATGEFKEEAIRFVNWRAFWGTFSNEKFEMNIKAIRRFTAWFESRSYEVLGKYSKNVDSFVSENKKKYLWREDRISCSRPRIEYHLNMVGAELMNRAFKKEFVETGPTALLLPGCMRIHLNHGCKAKKEEKGLKCTGCTSSCRVNQLREMGKKKHFEVYIIPHASDLSLWSPKEGESKCGVIASACVTTLVEGGWELKRYNIPAQCVLLEYSGCKKHWHSTGIPTEINNRELKRILESKHNLN
ncbi:MAG TPA: DUF116 domain-containing protein [Ignavibacteriaceae bacterium]|nr:DUF116 domain-containing protein [Ignavibacteriaceae bacterium]